MPEPLARIRKVVVVLQETHTEAGRPVTPPTRRAAALAVIENPFAGRYVEDLSPLFAVGEALGRLLIARAVAALGIKGAPVRAALGGGAALIPSSKKRGGPGVAFDIPLGHKDAAFVRSHFDGMEVRIADAPRANEIVVALAVTDSGRPLPRVGGLQAHEAKGEDGLR